MSPSRGAPPGRLRRIAGALRPSRFEARIALALVLAASVPLVGGLLLADRLTRENLAVWLSPRVVEQLQEIPSLYGDLFQARKQLYAEQARALARGLPRDRAAGAAYLASALERTPRLRRVAWYGANGALLAEGETQAPFEEGEWREAPARVALPDGGRLECVFAIEARYFAELADARSIAQTARDVDRLRGGIRRSYVLAFGAFLLVWATAAAIAGVLLARSATRRIAALMGALPRLAAGDFTVRVDPGRSQDEVAGLVRKFNEMVGEVKEGRDRIVYLEKISGWQDVARRLAHEIKNPLTPIQLAFQQLQARWKQVPEARRDRDFDRLLADAGDIVKDEIGTLQRLVEEFSGFAKLPEVRPAPAELGEFVEDFVRTSPQLAGAADVDVVRATAQVPVALDRALMRRVLANLCQNAVEAVRPARAKVHLGIARTRDRAVLTVADDGPGIDRELWGRIFDPYFTKGKAGGTGLGLAIVKKIVLQHGGEIHVGDRPGGGASFTIALPLAPDEPGAPQAS
jgi:nitrogen fixation/metabolism regulation signal transduction histidine kinase